MSQNFPFIFGAGPSQQPPAPPLKTQQPQPQQVASSQTMHPPASTMAAQLAALGQNAQLSNADLSQLQNISEDQLALILRLMTSGALPMPPKVPPETAQHSLPVPSQIASAAQANALQAQEQDVDMDREEGELEEGEVGDTAQDRTFLRPPPTGPRKNSTSPRGSLSRQERKKPSPKSTSPNQQPGQSTRVQTQATSQPKTNGHTNGRPAISKDAASKIFVLEMVKAGYTFDQLAKEVSNPKPLIRMFKQLDLPLPSEQMPAEAPQVNGTANSHAIRPSLGEEQRKPSITKKPAALAKPAAVDRTEYLARLQAAKNKKAEISTPTTAPASDPIPKPATPVHKVQQPQSSQMNGLSNSSPAKGVDKTELARLRLKALKAQEAAKLNGTPASAGPQTRSSPVPIPLPTQRPTQQVLPSSQQNGLGAGFAGLGAKAAQQAMDLQRPPALPSQLAAPPIPAQSIVSPPPLTPSRSFSGLPGLFMAGTPAPVTTPAFPAPIGATQPASAAVANSNVIQTQPQQQHGFAKPEVVAVTPTASPAPLTVPRKRPVASDFDDVFTKPSSVKRPFGQSRNASEDESLIIEISDDGDEDNNMDVEAAMDSSKQIALPQTKSFRDVGPLRDFPPRPNFQIQGSAPGTPGGATPGGATYEQKMKEVDDIKRKIAEAERRRAAKQKSSGGVTPDPKTAMLSETEVGQIAASMLSPATHQTSSVTQAAGQADETSTNTGARSQSATALARKEEKERLQRRIRELEIGASFGLVEAVTSTAAVEPEPTLSDTLQASAEEPEPVQNRQTPGDIDQEAVASGFVDDQASEEGELSDDSMSKFYEDARENMTSEPPAADHSKVGSQATTASAISAAYADTSRGEHTEQAETATSAEDFEVGSPDRDLEMGEVVEDDEADLDSREAQLEHSLPHAQAANADDVEVVVHGVPDDAESSSDEDDMELEESIQADDEESDESDEDDGDLDRPVNQTPNTTQPATHSSESMEEGEVDQDDCESASSDDEEDYEPEPMEGVPIPAEVSEVSRDDPMTGISEIEPVESSTRMETADDDLAPELQPASEDEVIVADQVPASSKHESHYTPYVSALRDFKDFRFHPDFLKTHTGGFKSATYNHKIDADKVLCPYEVAQGKCTQKDCVYQHFAEMTVPDKDLLANLGTRDIPAHTAEDIKRWNMELGKVLKGLRSLPEGRDAESIARRIVVFRRQYLGAESWNVLGL